MATSSVPLSQALSSAASGLTSEAGTLQNYLDGIYNNFGPSGTSSPQVSTAASAVSNIANSFALFSTPSRFAAFVIGVILIGGGILVFVFQPNVNSLRGAARRVITA